MSQPQQEIVNIQFSTPDPGTSMEIIRSKEFQGTRPWDALHVATLAGTSVRLHWTDQPYVWHINDGQEVFAYLKRK